VIEEMASWQARTLDEIYPAVFIDAIVVKVRDGPVANRYKPHRRTRAHGLGLPDVSCERRPKGG
jgi:Transposase, Mutator family